MNANIRVRIAPAPSGYLHVGTARTAIFNYLFARYNGGKFLVRIEDTDEKTAKPELIDPILDALKWLGVDWDEPPVFQSQRLEIYPRFIEELLKTGKAYRCFLTPEELDAERKILQKEKKPIRFSDRDLTEDQITERLNRGVPFAVRMKIPEGESSYDDLVLGKITRNNNEIEDFAISRNDGRALYNMAVVVDDHDMRITHVIRGNDHINNTFKQIMIYKALNCEVPQFAHVPLILRPDKSKVSKRKGDKDVAEFGREGILPEALFNFLCLLGWSPKDDREYLSKSELVDIFRLENINPSNPIFNEEKLLAMNAEYIRSYPEFKLAQLTAPMFVEAGLTTRYWLETRWEYLLRIIALLKERSRRLTDFPEQALYFFYSEFDYDENAATKNFNDDGLKYLQKLSDSIESMEIYNKENLEQVFNDAAEELNVKRGKLIHPTRLAVSGVPHGPGLFDLLEVLGKDQVLIRMQRAIDYIGRGKG
jgi:glutamyl-tRNA synthetase